MAEYTAWVLLYGAFLLNSVGDCLLCLICLPFCWVVFIAGFWVVCVCVVSVVYFARTVLRWLRLVWITVRVVYGFVIILLLCC